LGDIFPSCRAIGQLGASQCAETPVRILSTLGLLDVVKLFVDVG
jgi:hypothetical protein